jgi:hypothetical protein
MKNKSCQSYFFFFVFVFLLSATCSCSQKSAPIKIKSGVKEYSYRKIEHKIKDLEKDPLNRRWIETEHCGIQYSNEFEEHLENMVKISEDAYEKVAKDLKLSIKGGKPQIFFANRYEFEHLATQELATHSGFCVKDSIIINVDQAKLDDENIGYTGKVVTHEMTHFFFHQITSQNQVGAPPKSSRLFSEGLADYEEFADGELGEVLFRAFPEGNFLSLQEMNSEYEDTNYHKSIVEFWVMIKFVVDNWGKKTLLDIVHSLDRLTVQEAIEAYTKMPFTQFEEEWFRYMKELLDNSKIKIPMRGSDQEEDTAKSPLP